MNRIKMLLPIICLFLPLTNPLFRGNTFFQGCNYKNIFRGVNIKIIDSPSPFKGQQCKQAFSVT